MMKRNTWLALIACLVLALSLLLLAGCGSTASSGDDTAASTDTSTSTDTSNTDTEPAADADADTEPVADTETDAEPAADTDTETDTEPATDTETDTEPAADTEADADTVESDADADTELAADAQTDAEPAPDTAAAGSALFAETQETVDSPSWVSTMPPVQDPSATQVLIVAAVDRTTASVSLHQRDESGSWKQILTTPAFLGKNGLCRDDEHKESSEQTPMGLYAFCDAFGIAADPGCAIPYTQVTEDSYWSNEMVSLSENPDLDTANSIHLTDYPYAYQYVLSLNFNEDGVAGKGTAIFLQCLDATKPYTNGSVAIPEYSMKQIMQQVQPDCVVVIDTLEHMRGSL